MYNTASPTHLYRAIIRHTGTYAVGAGVAAVVGVAMMPVYTRYLSPAQYGVIAILDTTTQMLVTLITGGLTAASLRIAAEAPSTATRDRIWSTALTYVTAIAGLVSVLGLLASGPLASWALGSGDLAWLYRLTFVTMLMGVVSGATSTDLVASHRSHTITFCSLTQLLMRVALNLWLIVYLSLGVEGFLYTALIVETISAIVLIPWALMRWRPTFSPDLLRRILSFGLPLVPAMICATIMHHSDQLVLRYFLGITEVGIYSTGYRIVMMANIFLLTPFTTAWGPIVYDVARREDAPATYATVMSLFMYVVITVMLALSMFAREAVTLLTGPQFRQAHDIIPIVALGYVFYAMHEHIKVPVLLTKRTGLFPIVYATSAALNIVLNIILVPHWGRQGAAISTTLTFLAFSTLGFFTYRSLYHIPFPFARLGAVIILAAGHFGASELLADATPWVHVAPRLGLLVLFAAIVLTLAVRDNTLALFRSSVARAP